MENLTNESYTFKDIDDKILILDYIGDSKDVVIPDYINNKPVVAIMREAFDNKKLEAVVLPKYLEFIDEDAFYQNQIKEIVIPASVIKIGGGAFGRNKIEKLTIEAEIDSLPMFCFVGNNIENLTIPASVTSISNDCFGENKYLKKVTLPECLLEDKKNIFGGCDIDNITFIPI
ncbi:leucine-rich repeat domain-containing protein [Pseudoalteromonas sp. SR44-5]|uniref:leucine-rich repeat domain-containing protein n=1 Tax=unclassified Pseudoalteromonas TaxID=194690 RepID=UPI0016017EAD|nr:MULTISPECIES: leucine-rich repeat domain-containing protein [unclassified Pseudoalteromonas]MBB1336059.1 leucine-rich repeat domain-containing protein [Pseudoalteromonas sp. SR41-6]MBB1369068.1 leucine-rich repeat domain-containing protein [Pseudoalteromonas sp. SR44-5]MBB1422619.1 leucine-rich repeat domain-containing protein [Pseudoalteromonas sp. SG43-7]MBB1461632.1 leucine-rich repeat domain-containing protein [Pseudoalteromonas sp. SG41-8]